MGRQFGVDVARTRCIEPEGTYRLRMIFSENRYPLFGIMRLRLQILLQNRHLDREAAIVGEHHADEFIARVQIG
jgi:hypothetical protein